MELEEHFAKILAEEPAFDQEMAAAILQSAIQLGIKHNEPYGVVTILMELVHGRSDPDTDPTAHDALLQPVVDHVRDVYPAGFEAFAVAFAEDYPDALGLIGGVLPKADAASCCSTPCSPKETGCGTKPCCGPNSCGS